MDRVNIGLLLTLMCAVRQKARTLITLLDTARLLRERKELMYVISCPPIPDEYEEKIEGEINKMIGNIAKVIESSRTTPQDGTQN